MSLEIDLLKTFLAVVDTGSFTRAAKHSFRTQSAISMQMKRLEEHSGQPLFRKEGRDLVLTEAGKVLVGYARRIMLLHDEAAVRLQQGWADQPIRLGCPSDYMDMICPSLIQALRQKIPQVGIQIITANSPDLRPLLDQGELELAVLTRLPDTDEGHVLLHDEGVWLVADHFDPAAHKHLPLALYEPSCKFHTAARDGLEKQGRAYEVICTASSPTLLATLVRNGQAISAMARCSAPEDLLLSPQALDLPPLPSTDIVLATGAMPHPLLGARQLQQLLTTFQQRISTRG